MAVTEEQVPLLILDPGARRLRGEAFTAIQFSQSFTDHPVDFGRVAGEQDFVFQLASELQPVRFRKLLDRLLDRFQGHS